MEFKINTPSTVTTKFGAIYVYQTVLYVFIVDTIYSLNELKKEKIKLRCMQMKI